MLTAIVLGVYGRIAWGQFIGSGDFRAHLAVAQHLLETGRPAIPHFLFHGVAAALVAAHLVSTLLLAARLELLACYLLLAISMYGLMWMLFRETRIGSPGVLFAAALALLVAEPLTLAPAYSLGYLWLETYVIPTSTVLKPFALIAFALTVWYLSGRRKTRNPLLTFIYALSILLGSLSKPSFIICLLPASAAIALYRLARRLPLSVTELACGLYIPAAAVLGWQYYVTYSGSAASLMYHDRVIWAPLKFFNYWTTHLVQKLLCSVAFPLTVTILFRRGALKDAMFQLAWACFLCGAFYTYCLAEKNSWTAGNFVWSGYITLFTLFVAAAVFLLRQWATAPAAGGLRWRIAVSAGVLLLHTAAGVRIDIFYLTHYGQTIPMG